MRSRRCATVRSFAAIGHDLGRQTDQPQLLKYHGTVGFIAQPLSLRVVTQWRQRRHPGTAR
jgi:hypothetical protein